MHGPKAARCLSPLAHPVCSVRCHRGSQALWVLSRQREGCGQRASCGGKVLLVPSVPETENKAFAGQLQGGCSWLRFPPVKILHPDLHRDCHHGLHRVIRHSTPTWQVMRGTQKESPASAMLPMWELTSAASPWRVRGGEGASQVRGPMWGCCRRWLTNVAHVTSDDGSRGWEPARGQARMQ